MPVNVINQPTQYPSVIGYVIRFLAWLQRNNKWQMSPDPYPHDALHSKPANFEKTHNVSINRLEVSDIPTEWEHGEHWRPLIIRRDSATKSKYMLNYWHGGAFINMMGMNHWRFLGMLANELEADVAVQTYTMVPYAGIQENIEMLLFMYQRVRNLAKQNDQELLIGGDSAGGHITAAMLLALNDRNLPQPDQAIMISPGLVVDVDTPENRALESRDVMLSVDKLLNATRGWGTGPIEKARVLQLPIAPTAEEIVKINHPYAAPINGDWSFLAKAKVPITLIMGTYDLLLPQVDAFVEKAKSLNLELTYIRAEGCCHCYPMVKVLPCASYVAPDSIEGYRLMVGSIRKYSKARALSTN